MPVELSLSDAHVGQTGVAAMANAQHLALLKQGVDVWNDWRKKEPSIIPDLRGADLRSWNLAGANLRGADLIKADLTGANLILVKLSGANLFGARLEQANLSGAWLEQASFVRADLGSAILTGANLSGAKLNDANLFLANFTEANLRGADLSLTNMRGADLIKTDLGGARLEQANLHQANLREANLREANFRGALLLETDLTDAVLDGCRIYGISAWNVTLTEGTKQQGLVITSTWEPEVTTDDLEVAQFIHLLLHNEKAPKGHRHHHFKSCADPRPFFAGAEGGPRRAAGRTPHAQLRAGGLRLREAEVWNDNHTITLLARMARFVIADISDAKSVLQELQAIVPHSPKLPVLPIIVTGQEEPGIFDSIEAYPSVLKVHRYDSLTQLLADLKDRVIGPLEAEVAKLR